MLEHSIYQISWYNNNTKNIILNLFNEWFIFRFLHLNRFVYVCYPFNLVAGLFSIKDRVLEIPDFNGNPQLIVLPLLPLFSSGEFILTSILADPKWPIANIQIHFSTKPMLNSFFNLKLIFVYKFQNKYLWYSH
jgi:hypothetical protein